MAKLDSYLTKELAGATFATAIVLFVVSVGAAFTDVLRDIAEGKVPAGMMLSQLGLVLVGATPIILPLALMLGIMLAVGRLYRDSEMPVIHAAGVGPKRFLRPLMYVVVPILLVVGIASIWLGPAAKAESAKMISAANRNLVVAGLTPGSFTELPNGAGVVFVGSTNDEGSDLSDIFVYRQNEKRMDITSAPNASVVIDDNGRRFISLKDGFEVEGPRDGSKDYRLLRYKKNDVLMPEGERKYDANAPEFRPFLSLVGDSDPQAQAQLHYRLTPLFLTLAFALMAVPLARSMPRQARYGRVMFGFLLYMVAFDLMLLSRNWIEDGKLSGSLGMWWISLPLLIAGVYMYLRDGRVASPKIALPILRKGGAA